MVWRRLAARAFDELVVLLVQGTCLVIAAVLVGLGVGIGSPGDRAEIVAWGGGIVAVGWLMSVAYEIGSTRSGASIGKAMFRLTIVDAGAGAHRPSWRKATRRWALVAAPQPLVWTALGLGGQESLQARILIIVALVTSVSWRLSLLASMMLNHGETSFHDRSANTRVIPATQSAGYA